MMMLLIGALTVPVLCGVGLTIAFLGTDTEQFA